MYCPRCAIENLDNNKFCRACGADLESVSLVLADQHKPFDSSRLKAPAGKESLEWLKKKSRAIRNTIQGSILTITSVLIAISMGIFWHNPDWMIIWVVFFSWLAGWGVIQLAMGIGGSVEARMMLKGLETNALRGAVTAEIESEVGPTTGRLTSPASPTENTTKLLEEE